MAAGQCKVDPVTGLAGAIYTALAADGDNGMLAAAFVSGGDTRKLLGALLQAISTGTADYTAVVVQSKSSGFTASVGTHYRCDTSGGGFTATLPDPASVDTGTSVTIKKVSADGNTLTIATAAGTIDGDATKSIVLQWTAITVRSTGSVWDIT